MFEQIMVPLDGSSLAERTLPHTVALAQAFDAKVLLFRALERRRSATDTRSVDPVDWHMRKAEAKSYLDGAASRLRDADIRVDTVIEEGPAAERIIQFAQEEDVDLIVISSHGRSGLSQWNVNSVVQKVILRAYMPVMIVRAYLSVPEELGELQYHKLMVPLDGSQRAEHVLPLATSLSKFHDCPLLLAHVVRRPEMPRRTPPSDEDVELVEKLTERNRERGAKYMEELTSRLSANVRTRLMVSDNVSEGLHELIGEEGIDLIILSAHGYTGGSRWPYGSVALNFIAYGDTPLIIMQDLSKEEIEASLAEKATREHKGHA